MGGGGGELHQSYWHREREKKRGEEKGEADGEVEGSIECDLGRSREKKKWKDEKREVGLVKNIRAIVFKY
jgi:hypothetical protein